MRRSMKRSMRNSMRRSMMKFNKVHSPMKLPDKRIKVTHHPHIQRDETPQDAKHHQYDLSEDINLSGEYVRRVAEIYFDVLMIYVKCLLSTTVLRAWWLEDKRAMRVYQITCCTW
jgi:hypothetical protein